ncbi:uncharacterized protein [Hetaerina americana]|uniref:uncharacterized protein n=1 Tax=Hetaerina americana TaxID=62018 RepID=UPI003A7F46F7
MARCETSESEMSLLISGKAEQEKKEKAPQPPSVKRRRYLCKSSKIDLGFSPKTYEEDINTTKPLPNKLTSKRKHPDDAEGATALREGAKEEASDFKSLSFQLKVGETDPRKHRDLHEDTDCSWDLVKSKRLKIQFEEPKVVEVPPPTIIAKGWPSMGNFGSSDDSQKPDLMNMVVESDVPEIASPMRRGKMLPEMSRLSDEFAELLIEEKMAYQDDR